MGNILFIGGTGEISSAAVGHAVRSGHDVTVFNRGRGRGHALPPGVAVVAGDIGDEAGYRRLADRSYDVVCQFIAYEPEQIRRDIEVFTGRTDQYVFISSASCYQKPARQTVITERVPLENPYWEYSQAKIACEAALRAQSKLPYTIVRPTHTVNAFLPIQLGPALDGARRILAGRPLPVTGDGTSLWTLTRAEDFAPPFVALFGKERALFEDFHLTSDHAFSWLEIHAAIGRALGVEAISVGVTTADLVRHRPEWLGPLMGDKTWSTIFDNSKVKGVVGDYASAASLDAIIASAVSATEQALRTEGSAPSEAELDQLVDQLVRGGERVHIV